MKPILELTLREKYDDIEHPLLYETNDPWAPGGSDRHYFVALNPNTEREVSIEVIEEIYEYISTLRSMIEREVR